MSEKKISFWHPASLICTVFGVGKIPFAPGTWGSLAGVVLVLLFSYIENCAARNALSEAGGLFAYCFAPYPPEYNSAILLNKIFVAVFLLLLFVIGVRASNVFEAKTGVKDSKQIVIDEVVGQILTFYIVFEFISFQDMRLILTWNFSVINIFLYTVPFITFRLFDIVKRGPVGWCDRNIKGGMGVMLDDVVAGILAGLTSSLIFWLLTLI